MAKPAPEPEPTEEEATDPAKRMDQLEAKQETLSGKLDQILGILGSKDKPADGPADPAGSPDIASQIREQLAERDRQAAAANAEAERDGTVAALRAKVEELTEQAPAPMPRRVERLMGWT